VSFRANAHPEAIAACMRALELGEQSVLDNAAATLANCLPDAAPWEAFITIH
jgi:hypothetical protein